MRVFVQAFAVGEFNNGPQHARFDATPEFFQRLKHLQALLEEHRLSSVREWHAIAWEDTEEWRISCEELVVERGTFWFAGFPKSADYEVETRRIDNELEALVAQARVKGKTAVFYGLHQDEIDELRDSPLTELEDYTGPIGVGTRIRSISGETSDTSERQDVSTGPGAIGVVEKIFPDQEHCYAVVFPDSGVSVFLSKTELDNQMAYEVI